ncbi:MAG: hypothetical protein A3A73_01830 [Omnitrophica bacterium RIFCSPLOWO2_01_FULL_50_24]|nr:MAG: hypothetical protein A3A73_01830 [Omnitrophica bacterium RIFCSPLOWO2_01_FULL_50_24]
MVREVPAGTVRWLTMYGLSAFVHTTSPEMLPEMVVEAAAGVVREKENRRARRTVRLRIK